MFALTFDKCMQVGKNWLQILWGDEPHLSLSKMMNTQSSSMWIMKIFHQFLIESHIFSKNCCLDEIYCNICDLTRYSFCFEEMYPLGPTISSITSKCYKNMLQNPILLYGPDNEDNTRQQWTKKVKNFLTLDLHSVFAITAF